MFIQGVIPWQGITPWFIDEENDEDENETNERNV